MENIEMIPVASSNVESIGYDEQQQILYVRFLSGTTYKYLNVPLIEFEQLKNAPSIGSYMHRNIKSFYPYERIS